LFLTDADLNKVDKYGRSPLHVASAVDYVAMVEFLLENGACVDAETFGERQTALHFAAKNDAVNAMKMLLAHKSDINCNDYKNRTPLQVTKYSRNLPKYTGESESNG
jgi:ankyrin repeat protein